MWVNTLAIPLAIGSAVAGHFGPSSVMAFTCSPHSGANLNDNVQHDARWFRDVVVLCVAAGVAVIASAFVFYHCTGVLRF